MQSKRRGSIIKREEIVSKSGTLIDDIYQLKNKLSKKFTDSLLKLNLEEKKKLKN